MPIHVKVNGAPGFVDGFDALLIPGLGNIAAKDDRGPLAVITTEAGDLHVVPASTVTITHVDPVPPVDSPEAARYREEWSVKADRNPRDVYIPEALR